MIIQRVPQLFQPTYNAMFPLYTSGKHMEEMFFRYFSHFQRSIKSSYVYLPVFWTSYYKNGGDIEVLKTWLHKLDKTKKYITIVQNDCGIYVNNLQLNIKVCGPSGGLNTNGDIDIYTGKKADIIIPLLCDPEFPLRNLEKDIICSYIPTEHNIYPQLSDISDISSFNITDPNEYCDILNRSVFTLAPRDVGYTSFRLYEAILAGCIPIYIWENEMVLPFPSRINWGEICIMVNINHIHTIYERINKVNLHVMQKSVERMREQISYDKTFEYIREQIENK